MRGSVDTMTPELSAADYVAEGERALYDYGSLHNGRIWFDAAYRAAVREGDVEATARAALGLGGLWVHEHRTVASASQVRARQRHALSLLDPDSPLAQRLRVRLAAEDDYRDGTHDDVLAALAEVRRGGDPVALAEALSTAHHCVLAPGQGLLRGALAADLIAVAGSTGRRSDLLMGLLWQTIDQFLDADPHAERCMRQLRDLVAGEPHLATGYVVGVMEVMLCIRAGQFERAEQLAVRCAERGRLAGDADADAWFGAQMVAIRWYQGRLVEVLPFLRRLVHDSTLSPVDNSLFGALAVAEALSGERREAAGALARLCGRDVSALPRSSSWLVAMYGAVEAAHLLGDGALSARVYELLTPFARLPVIASLGVACFGSAEHALGVAALTTGALDSAVAHFENAVRDNLALGHWPAVVQSRTRLAQAYRLRGGADDPAAARLSLATAAREASAIGMAVPAQAAPAEPVTCRRSGRRWELRLGHHRATVENSVGMRHLAVLLAHPGREIAASELVTGPEPLPDRGSAQPLLDDAAKREYRERLDRLAAEIDDAEFANDLERAARARAERSWLIAELAAATGLGGRSRHFADGEERARIAVGKAIRRALARVAEADPVIGRALQDSVTTGLRCSYTP
ncbi:hypothetical protein Val02_01460 [Virgisporangium aliadipatigenens]|uniref:Uncharacterized protein n=1 Tax=Virgisporangium aliadipatigenens TaxID=741659 RepID=A0A8J3YFW3_9ACTN|nr:hypothetical protein [Virgisporangium aliadipatigenens]GIJ43260.1 hypothetical protein Val02_01460 [Virgisporangium aliadipatigenens]